MTELIACLGTGKGTWSHVSKIINAESWDSVFLITNEFGRDKFGCKNADYIIIDPNMLIKDLATFIRNDLSGRIKGIEVALNISSGDGKTHMAILSALLKLGLSVRMIDLINGKVEEV